MFCIVGAKEEGLSLLLIPIAANLLLLLCVGAGTIYADTGQGPILVGDVVEVEEERRHAAEAMPT